MKQHAVQKGWLTTPAAAAFYLLAAAPACARSIGGGESLDVPLLRIVLGLIICVIVAFGAALLLRHRFGNEKPSLLNQILRQTQAGAKSDASRRIVVLESRRISAHADVCRFSASDREYLVLVSPSSSVVLHQTTHPPITDREDP